MGDNKGISPMDLQRSREQEQLDDDGKPRRTGTVWTASAHIITAVIGSGVLSLAWAMAQLGWIFGPLSLFLFSVITLYTSRLLADCYRNPDPITGTRNYTYMEAVKSYLGGRQLWLCGVCQYVNLFGSGIGYTITASISAAAVNKANCYHKRGHSASCLVSDSMYMVGFGIAEVFLSQLRNMHDLLWVSIAAAIMSFTYSLISIGLSLARVVSGHVAKTTLTGVQIGVDISAGQKVWSTFQALGDIAFAYSYSMVLIEIQDTLRSPPAENKQMKAAAGIGVWTTTLFYALSGCLGYLAFGNNAPGNILTGFGFYEPFWLIDLANVSIIVHLLGAYQVYLQPIFAAVENGVTRRWPNIKTDREYQVTITKNFSFNINVFRLIWRTCFVALTTLLSILMPFFNDILGLLGAVGFWPLTVYFPVEMYIVQKGIARFSPKWIKLQILSFLCLLVSIAAACGSIQGVAQGLKHYKPFQTKS